MPKTVEAPKEEFLAYCMRCKRKRRSVEGQYRTTPNGRGMMQGPCRVCGTKISVITKVRGK